MKNGVCPKCQGTIILQGVNVIDRGHANSQHGLSLAVDTNPTAWLFKGRVMGEMWACVCGTCGFTELYATNLDALVQAAAEGNSTAET